MKFATLGEIVREAAYGLYQRFSAALSMLRISWGIVSVVVLLAYGDGFRGAIDAGFKGAYSDVTVIVFPGQTSLQAGGERAGKRVRVTIEDVLAIGEIPLIKNVSPEFMRDFPVVFENKQSSLSFEQLPRRMEPCETRSRSPAAAFSMKRTCGCGGASPSSDPKCSASSSPAFLPSARRFASAASGSKWWVSAKRKSSCRTTTGRQILRLQPWSTGG
jgi:hypothetical protein